MAVFWNSPVDCFSWVAMTRALTVDQTEHREGRWVIPDLVGKGHRRRTVPVPAAVKHQVKEWILTAGITEGQTLPAHLEGRQPHRRLDAG